MNAIGKRVYQLPRGLSDSALLLLLNEWKLNNTDYMLAVDYYTAFERKIHAEGYKAASKNQLVTDCPYPENTPQYTETLPHHEEWMRGYHEWNDNHFGDIIN